MNQTIQLQTSLADTVNAYLATPSKVIPDEERNRYTTEFSSVYERICTPALLTRLDREIRLVDRVAELYRNMPGMNGTDWCDTRNQGIAENRAIADAFQSLRDSALKDYINRRHTQIMSTVEATFDQSMGYMFELVGAVANGQVTDGFYQVLQQSFDSISHYESATIAATAPGESTPE